MTVPSVAVDVHLSEQEWRAAQLDDLVEGLRSTPRTTGPVWFYDARGSELFEEITRLPEYYPTRAERSLLVAHAPAIAAAAGADTLVELGSGTSEKTTVLLDAMDGTGLLRRYVPFDVSEETVRRAASSLDAAYPAVQVHAVVGDFHRHLPLLPAGDRRLVAFLGGTIGNLEPGQRRHFLAELAAAMSSGDHLLLGVDLVKDVDAVVAAYDDAAGVTAAFNRNALHHINRAVGADFVPEAFDHVAAWDPEHRWIEMRLRSRVDQQVDLGRLDLVIQLRRGEELRTEISAKFTPDGISGELHAAGFVVDEVWGTDPGDFLLLLARPA